jgi:hypothetical protein
MHVAMIIATVVAVLGALVASRFIPKRAADTSHHGTDVSV